MRPRAPNDADGTPSNSMAELSELPASRLRESTAVAPVAGDMLYGADAIAEFLFGDRKHRRRVYNLVDGNGIPVFRIGVNICARRSVLSEWIAAQERVNVSATT